MEPSRPRDPPDAPPAGWPVPRAAYVHLPFCRRHCGYCNFTVITGRRDLQPAYLDALACELDALNEPRPVSTLYLGGGTPTDLGANQLRRVMQLCDRWFPRENSNDEFTIEANPEDLDQELLETIRDAGGNRLSLGVQSFQSEKLTRLERVHEPEMARQAIARASDVIGNVSVDLIFAAPDESLDAWKRDLEVVASSAVAHASVYALTYEKGSAYYGRLRRGELSEVDEERQLAMYGMAQDVLGTAGFEQYEVSNYARRGASSRHNRAYWEGRGWYAAGAGAARFVEGYREVNHRSTTRYIQLARQGESVVAERERLTVRQWMLERIAFGLRMLEGIDLEAIGREAGMDAMAILAPSLRKWDQWGLIRFERPRLRLTDRGLTLSDTVVQEVLAL